MIEKNIDKKLANRISYQIWYKGCLKEKFGRGSKSAKGGPYPLADLDREGGSKSAKGGPYPLADLDREGGSKSAGCPNPLWHRDDVSSHLKYYQLFREILEYKLILFRSGHFDHDMEKI